MGKLKFSIIYLILRNDSKMEKYTADKNTAIIFP